MDNKIVRVDCTVDERENEWIEFDTSEWTVKHFREISAGDMVEGLPRYVEVYACDWKITGLSGRPVDFPGKSAAVADWLDAYDQLDIDLAQWMSISPILALNKRMNPSPKSSGENSASSSA